MSWSQASRPPVVTDAEDAEHEQLRFAQAVALEVPAQLEKQLKMSAPEQIDEEVLAEAAVRLGRLRLLRHRCRRPLHRHGVASAMENERRPVEVIEGRDLADENDVVASLVIERGAALESSGAPGEQRDAVLAALE